MSGGGGGGGGGDDADNGDAVDGCNSSKQAAQASNKDASPPTESDNFEKSTTTINQRVASDMDATTEKRRNNINNNLSKRNMESEAATKIQAGFRGYQVRKQLKNKITTTGDISNQRRLVRRKSSGQMKKNHQTTATPTEIEERSAAKIQAGVRGFLVRRRQKKEKSKETTTS